MKRLLAVLLIALMVAGIALVASADPIDVGGSFTASSSSTGPAVYKGKGNPQGVPFQVPAVELLLSPIDVGGS